MGNLIFKKIVDQSLLNAGMTIPIENHQKVLDELGLDLNKGDKEKITVIIAEKEYEAILTSVDYSEKYAERTVLQIRYGAKSPICQALNSIFAYSARNIAQRKAEISGEKKQLSVEDEYVEIYSSGEKTLEFRCYPKNSESLFGTSENALLRPVIEMFLNNYVKSKQEMFAGHSVGNYIRNDAPEALYKTGLVDRQTYLVTGSVGQGNWAMVPWLCVFDKKITTTATKGVYIVYLLAKDGKSLYLTFNQGCTDIRKNNSIKETIRIMRKKADDISAYIDSRGFASDENINLGDGLTELGEMYQRGTIFYKKYEKDNVPNEKELQEDLSKMMDIYKEYVSGKSGKEPEALPKRGEDKLDTKNAVSEIKKYIAAKGFSYNDGLIENFYLSLKTKPFVILAGTSGTGKTRLVKLFAEAIGAEYKLIPVRPDWSDSSDLFGHIDLNGRFIPGAMLDFLKEAQDHPGKPYFLCLDEMNLARVEYYLSDILSVMETRDFKGEHIVSDLLVTEEKYGADKDALNKYGKIIFPENLYLIGTVNMDETTFPFSKKVLDRANTIEFNFVDLIPDFTNAGVSVSQQQLENDFLCTKYLLLSECAEQADYVSGVCAQLHTINMILQKANTHMGYRVRDEIVFYLLNNKNIGLLSEDEAMDNEIMQKILPRIQGSTASSRDMLCELFKICAADQNQYPGDSDAEKMRKALEDDSLKCKYRKSAEKLELMERRFEEDGFTSYWL